MAQSWANADFNTLMTPRYEERRFSISAAEDCAGIFLRWSRPSCTAHSGNPDPQIRNALFEAQPGQLAGFSKDLLVLLAPFAR